MDSTFIPSSWCFAVLLALSSARIFGAITPGEILIGEMNCLACHEAPAPVAARLASRPSPRLGAAHGVRPTPQWLRAFLENPQATQPGTLMPDLLAGLEAPARTEAAEALTHYLVSLRGTDDTPPITTNPEAIRDGQKLYHRVGCVACHAPTELPPGAPRNEESQTLKGLQKASVPFGDLPKKYRTVELAAFLRDPLQSRPGGRMPSLKLSASEAESIALFLFEGSKLHQPAPTPSFVLDEAKVTKGRELFASLNCAACHPIDAPGRKAKAFSALNGRQPGGCLATKPKPGIPKFELTERQRAVILAQLGNQAELHEPLTAEQQITRTMTTLNCYACHTRNRRGGIDASRRDYFTTAGQMKASDEKRFPPALQGVGKRLRAGLLRKVLIDGLSTRPDLATRMPLYGAPNIGHLPELFEKADTQSAAAP